MTANNYFLVIDAPDDDEEQEHKKELLKAKCEKECKIKGTLSNLLSHPEKSSNLLIYLDLVYPKTQSLICC